MNHDQILASAEKKMTARLGSKAFPWASILEALMQLLIGACQKPEAIRKEAKSPGPFNRIRMRRQLRSMGVERGDIDQVADAAFEVAAEATDAEIAAFQRAAEDCCA